MTRTTQVVAPQKMGATHQQTSLSPGGKAVPQTASRLAQLQSYYGNQGMLQLMASGVLQRKLTVNQPGDVFEQEADRVADSVTRMPDPAAAPQPVTSVGPVAGLQRCSRGPSSSGGQCEECKSKAMALQRTSNPNSALDGATASLIVDEVLRSAGQPLDSATRSFMELRFGHDFSAVRLYTDAKAAESAHAVNAVAYTVGNKIVFAPDQYSPETQSGRRLLAHELAHVTQQTAASAGLLQRTPAFKDCKTKTKGKVDEREQLILQAIEDSKKLAKIGLASLDRIRFMKALRDNFGDLSDDQKKKVADRYQAIIDTLDNKTFECTKKCKKKKGTHLCAQGETPGSKIVICPEFAKESCPPDFTLLHEAAHNDGAGDDVDRGKGYPPKNAVDNAYSYENFVADVMKAATDEPKLPPKKDVVPKLP